MFFALALAAASANAAPPALSSGTISQSSESPPSAQPDAIGPQAAYIKDLSSSLERLLSILKDKPAHPLLFSANLVFARSDILPYIPTDALLQYVDALKEAGARRIDINLSIDPWRDHREEVIQKYDALVDHIHQAGLELAINPDYGAREDRTYSFDSWQADTLRYDADIARAYHPNIFIVVHEPTTLTARMGEDVLPRQWSVFAEKAIRIIKEASPQTRCGVGLLDYERENYLTPFLSVDGLDLLSLDIYTLRGLNTYNEMIAAAKAKGKAVYIEETWRPAYTDAGQALATKNLEDYTSSGVGDARYEAVDARWLIALARYASVWNLEAVTPFWTQTFFLYSPDGHTGGLDPDYNKEVISALHSGRRTQTFKTYQRLSHLLARQPSQ